jgi:hypothetical protein
MNTEGIPQAVRTGTPYSPGFRINEGWQTGSSGTIPDYLPRPMQVNIEETGLTINRSQGIDITFGHFQSGVINRKYTDTSFLLLTSYPLTDLESASGAELVPVAQTVPAMWA